MTSSSRPWEEDLSCRGSARHLGHSKVWLDPIGDTSRNVRAVSRSDDSSVFVWMTATITNRHFSRFSVHLFCVFQQKNIFRYTRSTPMNVVRKFVKNPQVKIKISKSALTIGQSIWPHLVRFGKNRMKARGEETFCVRSTFPSWMFKQKIPTEINQSKVESSLHQWPKSKICRLHTYYVGHLVIYQQIRHWLTIKSVRTKTMFKTKPCFKKYFSLFWLLIARILLLYEIALVQTVDFKNFPLKAKKPYCSAITIFCWSAPLWFLSVFNVRKLW